MLNHNSLSFAKVELQESDNLYCGKWRKNWSIEQSSSGRDGKLLKETVSLRLEEANNQCMFGPKHLQ